MKKILCKKCNIQQVAIKKHNLCLRCYSAAYRNGTLFNGNYVPISRPTLTKEKAEREIEFIKNYFIHKHLVHHPGIFRMNTISYAPDFYDAEGNIFIEVAGSRQAYHANKDKYLMMKTFYPKINLEVRQSDGTLIDLDYRVKWKDNESENKY